ncbi:hypothetical protein ACFCYN_04545 [Gottfriedia sp. NPDC056225]|uniref:hypothetical protein n=1 Tax=Gottfriedia sp. NPDC056225 TaxID=3345751 RepID=UPI0035E19B64
MKGLEKKVTYEEIEKRRLAHIEKLKQKGVLSEPRSIDFDEFIKYCEQEYAMTSKDFLPWYEKSEFEGNSDMKIWYTLIKDIEDEELRES